MAGSNSPYHLKPNKFIDRNLYLDLLSRILPKVGIEKYVYISMGAQHLVDQNSAYRKVGIENLCSIDNDEMIVKRQLINRPTAETVCLKLHSSELISELDFIMDRFEQSSNFALWLDYTKPASLAQFQEFEQLLGKMQHCDILRITMNADSASLKGENDKWKGRASSPGVFRLDNLKNKLGSYVPNNITKVTPDNYNEVLVQCLKRATEKASEGSSGMVFKPVLITAYQDTAPMLTLAILACSKAETTSFPKTLKEWEFYAGRWNSRCVDIMAPNFSPKEKFTIDKHLAETPTKILKLIDFNPETSVLDSRQSIAAYKRLHRYYPTFKEIDI